MIDRNKLFAMIIGIILISAAASYFIINTNELELDKIKIGIIDSGCAINQASSIFEYSVFTTMNNNYPYDDSSKYDNIGHGRYVCEILINGSPNSIIYSAKIANAEGLITYQGLFEAIKYMIEEKDVDIINLSLGGEFFVNTDLMNAFESYASDKLFIAAAGNKGNVGIHNSGYVDWPAVLPWVIGVGASEDGYDRSSYSSYGKNYEGFNVVEYVNSGKINNLAGTSFATPKITVVFAEAWYKLKNEGYEITPEKLNYIVSKSTEFEKFSNEIGWGAPILENIEYAEGVAIVGEDEIDGMDRFIGENWQKNWKIIGDIDVENFIFEGNGSEIVSQFNLIKYDWGKILEINFYSTNNSGKFILSINHEGNRGINYTFNVKDELIETEVLIDHSHSVNGYAHEYGEYFEIEKQLRNEGIYVKQTSIEVTELENYDLIIIPNFGETYKFDKIFNRTFKENIMDKYTNYVDMGGKIILHTPSSYNLDNNKYVNSINKLGGIITENMIKYSNNKMIYVQNLTSMSEFEGVKSIGIYGPEILPINSTQESLGWQMITNNNLRNYLSIGIKFKVGDGYVYILSGSSMLINDNFRNLNDNYDQFIYNVLSTI